MGNDSVQPVSLWKRTFDLPTTRKRPKTPKDLKGAEPQGVAIIAILSRLSQPNKATFNRAFHIERVNSVIFPKMFIVLSPVNFDPNVAI
jgi:hypothetical protein